MTSRIYSEKAPRNKLNKEVYGNWSKYAKNWISGPTHETATQRVPGYTGHVQGLIAENLFAKSYAKMTSKAFSKRHPIGADMVPKNRFRSSQREDFKPSNFRRFVENKEMVPQRDYSDFTKYVNESNTGNKESLLSRTMRDQARGSGFNTGLERRGNGSKTARNSNTLTGPEVDNLMTATGNDFFSNQRQNGAKQRHYSVDTRNLTFT